MGGGARAQALRGWVMVSERSRSVIAKEIAIRPAGLADVLSVGLIERQSFSDPWGSREFTTALESPQTIFLVAADSLGIVCGYAIAIAVADEAEILNLAVQPERRGERIGSRLLDAALAELGSRGATNVYLEVRESNETARRLYESRGFDEVSRRRRYYRNPVEDALILQLAMQ